MTPAGQMLIPALVLLPLLWLLPGAVHGGGLALLLQFWLAALQPSLDPHLLLTALRGIGVTLAIALWSWFLSLLLGFAGGLLSSVAVSQRLWRCTWPALLIRSLLAFPRSLHELLWGLILLQLMGLQTGVAVLAIALPYGALVARVMADQLDALPLQPIEALSTAGAPAWAALFTAFLPPLWPQVLSYGGYRLECALRSATLLGVFGLGGIGADLRLSLQSLQFHEVWTSLWCLAVVMLLLEGTVRWLQRRWHQPLGSVGQRGLELLLLALLLVLLLIPSAQLMELRWQELFSGWHWPESLPLWDGAGWMQPWLPLIGTTLLLTLLSALLALAITPWVLLLLCPWRGCRPLLQLLGLLARLLPPPLTALLLLFVLKPGLLPAVLALGLHNSGILGRLLLEGLDAQDQRAREALRLAGAGPRRSLLVAGFNTVARSYLSFGAYRADVILRESVVVGLVGAGGLGVLLLESLSSFAWIEVVPVLVVYAALTLIGESAADAYRSRLLSGPLPLEGLNQAVRS